MHVFCHVAGASVRRACPRRAARRVWQGGPPSAQRRPGSHRAAHADRDQASAAQAPLGSDSLLESMHLALNDTVSNPLGLIWIQLIKWMRSETK
eukprot:1673169-Pleurochrysis_carterae.AAC.3